MAGMEMMLDAMMSAGGAMTVGAVEQRLPRLAARLDKFDRAATLAKLGGLLRRTAALRSRHHRCVGLEPIQINHLWIEM